MKYLNYIIILILLTTLLIPAARAQNSVDINRMQRDINIMESILEELFKTRWEATDANVRIASSGNLLFRKSNDIRGTYLPDYGLIFTVSGNPPGNVTYHGGDDGDGYSYSFRYSDDSDRKEVNEDNVTERIKEFLREYGSTIGQLSTDDKIIVIYNSRVKNSASAIFIGNTANVKSWDLPTISVVIQKSDLEAYRSGKIDASELNNRFSVSKAGQEHKERLDLKVMGNIFETALNEQDDKAFRVRGSVSHLYLDNFGALFFFDARYSSPSGSFFFSMPEVAGFDISSEEKRGRIEVENVIQDKISDTAQKQIETADEVSKSFDVFLTNLKEYLVDYGRTLSSVKSGQNILLSATVSSQIKEIPERIDLQIKKSVLESVDSGSMSREEAMNQITVRKY